MADADFIEEWRACFGYERYEVSSLGRVRRVGGAIILKPDPQAKGHLRVSLSVDGKKRNVYVHKLVLEAFKGLQPEGMQCRHYDGCPTNNVPSNLLWGTQSQNAQDRERHGHGIRGASHPLVVLTEANVIEIRRRLDAGELSASLAREFHVHRSTISLLRRRKSWAYLP